MATCSRDLGNLGYREFLGELRRVIEIALGFVKVGGYAVLIAKDLQPTPEHHSMLHADVVAELSRIQGLSFRGYKIWHERTLPLYPFGYPLVYVSNQLHQYILIFRKEGV